MASNIKSDSATFEKKSYSGVFMPKGTIMGKKMKFPKFYEKLICRNFSDILHEVTRTCRKCLKMMKLTVYCFLDFYKKELCRTKFFLFFV